MKKTYLVLLVAVMFSMSMFSQDNTGQEDVPQNFNELKLNVTNLIGFKWVDIAYERTLNEESSVGISVLTRLGSNKNNDGGLDEYRTFSITPYFRQFFGKKHAQGFFVEGFAMVHSGEDQVYSFDNVTNTGSFNYNNYTDLAIGVSAGAKFVTRRGFVAEIYLGIGRDMLDQSDLDVVGRGGIALGYRF